MTTVAVPARYRPSQARRRWLRIALAILLVPVALVLAGLLGLIVVASGRTAALSSAPVQAETTRFDGRYLLAASDADMVGTAYADGILQQIPGDVDTLSLVELPLTDADARVIEIPVSNSVISWPQVIAVAPDGDTIYVAETAGPVEDTLTQLNTDDFPKGLLVTVVDIRGGAADAAITTVDVGYDTAHIALSADGAYLAVGLRDSQHLAILPTATLDDAATFQYFAFENRNGQSAEEVTSVSWHPSGEYLAIGIDRSELQFFRVTTGDDVALAPYGERLLLGNTITYGQFTRDGRYYLTAEINWNSAPAPLGNLINPSGEMISVRFDAQDAAHAVVSRVTVGLSPEGFAISQQEDLVVTVNMERTYLPNGLAFWPGAALNSLTLLTFDRETGELAQAGEAYGFEGVLPEHAAFDADGDSLGVVVYNERENPMNPGYIEFWNVVRDGDVPRLERTAVRLSVVRGPHAMAFVP